MRSELRFRVLTWVWTTLARSVRDAEAAGSNPAFPTIMVDFVLAVSVPLVLVAADRGWPILDLRAHLEVTGERTIPAA